MNNFNIYACSKWSRMHSQDTIGTMCKLAPASLSAERVMGMVAREVHLVHSTEGITPNYKKPLSWEAFYSSKQEAAED